MGNGTIWMMIITLGTICGGFIFLLIKSMRQG